MHLFQSPPVHLQVDTSAPYEPLMDLEHYKVKGIPYMLLVFLGPSFQSASFHDQSFWSYRPF